MVHHDTVAIRASKFLRAFEYGEKHFLYHTCLGNPREVTPDYAEFLEVVRQGVTMKDLDPYPELRSQTKELLELGLFEYGNQKQDFLEAGVEENRKKIPTGELVKLLVIDVSTRCNLACSYCNVHKTQEKHGITGASMKYDTARVAVDEYVALCKQANRRSAAISYFGGEPLLNYPMLERLMRYVAAVRDENVDLHLTHAVSTNGVLLNKERIETIKALDCQVAVSLDGLAMENDAQRTFSDGSGSFLMVAKNLRRLVAEGVPTQVVTTVDEHNAHTLKKFVDFLCEVGVNQVSIKGCIYRQISREERLSVSRSIMEAIDYARARGIVAHRGPGDLSYTRGCQGLGEMLCVEPSGDVFACPEGIRLKLGTVERLREIPASKEYEHVASRITGNIEACQGCDVEGLCRGGCAGESEYNFDDIYQIDTSSCEAIRENIKRNLAIFGGI